MIEQVYHGDIETKRTFGGCHLKPVFVQAEIDVLPAIKQSGSHWFLYASNANAKLTLLPGSDTRCSILGHDVAGRVNDAINADNIKAHAVDALNRLSVEVPVNQLWRDAEGPFVSHVDGLGQICLYPHLAAFWGGSLFGTIENGAITFVAKAHPEILVGSNTCPPQAMSAPALFDGQNTRPAAVVTDMNIPYATIKDALLANANIKNAGFDAVTFEPHEAYMTVKLHKTSGESISLNAVPIVPIPAEPGNVAVELVFTDIPGAPNSTDKSYLNGAYTKDLTDEVASLKKGLQGPHANGKFTLNVLNVSLAELFMTSDSDGLHNYFVMRLTANGNYRP